MKKIGLIFLILLFFGTMIFGKISYDNKISMQGKKAKEAAAKQLKDDEKKNQDLINSLNPENGNVSYFNYLQYRLLTNGKAKVVLVGDSVTVGTGASKPSLSWGGRLDTALGEIRDNNNYVEVINHGKSGKPTRSIKNDKIYEEVISDSPDLVIFEIPLINDHASSIPLEETKGNINFIINEIKGKLPNAKILLTSPDPTTKLSGANTIGLTYDDYLSRIKSFITENGWDYVDIYEGMNAQISEQKLKLDDLLIDGVHPNDNGYKLWFDTLYDFMKNRKVL